jgi:hypothetical protein
MPQLMLARITCAHCQQRFEAPVEQVLDVRADPSAKLRVLNSAVNTVACPHCGARGALNLPFLYHDPEKQLALVYMPMEAGRDHLERQLEIGKFTRAVMDSLPAEERKGYLLQPQVFLTPETLANKILEADGVTPEMMEEQRARAELLQRMLRAESDEALEALIRENDDRIDGPFLRLIVINVEMVRSTGNEQAIARMNRIREKVLALSREGQAAVARGAAVEALQAEPTREKLLELLIGADDPHTREALITVGRPLLDYAFFQALTARIEATADAEERKRLEALRQQILDVREELDAETRAQYEKRADLLRDLLVSEDPARLARYRFAEMDDIFMTVLRAHIEQATQAKNEAALTALRKVWDLTMRLMEEATPPALRFLGMLMRAENEQQIDEILAANRRLVTEQMVEALAGMEANMREDGETESADHLALVLRKARAMLLQPA